jgi:hypothetical protein
MPKNESKHKVALMNKKEKQGLGQEIPTITSKSIHTGVRNVEELLQNSKKYDGILR